MRLPKIYGTGEKVILSVEDDHAAYLLLEMGFQDVGGDFRLYRVEDGAQALAFLRRTGPYADAPKPHLILLNLNLPRVTGFDVLETMKNDPALEDIPSVVFSSSRMDKDKAKCLALGARGFMTKPSDLDEFLNVLRHVCSLVVAA
jgi:CheY-like chemotaxis protein